MPSATSGCGASFRETIVTMTRAAAYKDEETGAHVARISHYSEELARTLGMGAEFRDTIRFASPMHDIGKIAIPDAILGKSGPFEPHEWQVMKTHAALGEKMLRGTDSPYRETANIYDGSRFTADMAVQNVIGDAFRGATWVSLHNGGGVGWGEVINGGFG